MNRLADDRGGRAFQGEAQGAPNRGAAIDRALREVAEQVSRYKAGVERLVIALEGDRPVPAQEANVKKAYSNTVADALCGITDIIGETNERLEATIARVQEQVGEFKILP